jgi:16S rRNA (cytosine1402-N4)-methyltransferase
MQLDDPTRGFSTKFAGPLDMRMNPGRGASAATLLQRLDSNALTEILREHADEPYAEVLGPALAGKSYATTTELSAAIRDALARKHKDDQDLAVRRVFQALRIAVNDEFSALESLLRHLPGCLKPGGKVAILTFHSGEDRRVKKSFEAGLRSGAYAEIASEIMRPDAEEQHANPRSRSAKLRWARKTG